MWVTWCYRLILLGLILAITGELLRESRMTGKAVAALVLIPLFLRFLGVA